MKVYKSLGTEVQLAFDINAENYLKDDIHRGNDVDLICKVGNDLQEKLQRKIDILYVGVGPGEVLENMLKNGRFYNKIKAIDYSSNMCRLCASRIEKLGQKMRNIVTIEKKNLFDLDNCKESYDMILLLNNTLGNIVVNNSGEEGRISALNLIHKLLRPSGILFLTVYNFEKLEIKNNHYTPKLKLLKRNGQDLFFELTLKGVSHMFYAHWFTIKEVKDLLQNRGFVISDSDIILKEARIIAIARRE